MFNPVDVKMVERDFAQAELLTWARSQLFEPVDKKLLRRFRRRFKVPKAQLYLNGCHSVGIGRDHIVLNARAGWCEFSLGVRGDGVVDVKVHTDGSLTVWEEVAVEE